MDWKFKVIFKFSNYRTWTFASKIHRISTWKFDGNVTRNRKVGSWNSQKIDQCLTKNPIRITKRWTATESINSYENFFTSSHKKKRKKKAKNKKIGCNFTQSRSKMNRNGSSKLHHRNYGSQTAAKHELIDIKPRSIKPDFMICHSKRNNCWIIADAGRFR